MAVDGGRILMVRRAGPGLWAGFWEFPTIHRGGPDPAGRAVDPPVGLEEGVERLTGVPISSGEMVKSLTYGVTRYRVRLDAFAAAAGPRRGPARGCRRRRGCRGSGWAS